MNSKDIHYIPNQASHTILIHKCYGRYVRRRHFGVFSVFFQDLCELVIHCNKRLIFVCLFFLLTITSRNEAIIVEFKKLFVLNGTFITCSGGSHH